MEPEASAVTVEDGMDDYVVIDFVRAHKEASPSESPVASPCASPVKNLGMDTSSLDSGYEEFVIVEEPPAPETNTPAGAVSRLFIMHMFC